MTRKYTKAPIHPGEILKEEFMTPLGISVNRLSRDLSVPPNRISEIVNRKRGISAGTALRLARYFNTTAQFWMNLQSAYDLEISERAEATEIRERVRPLSDPVYA
jgi:addiction module HigA family antidote